MLPTAAARGACALGVILCLSAGATVAGIEVTPAAIAAFDRYVALSEARMARDRAHGAFMWMDGLDADRRRAAEADLRRGTLIVRREVTLDERGQAIPVPGGQLHHWRAIIFVPGASVDRMLALAQDYANYKDYFHEVIRKSRVVDRRGNQFKVALRFHLSRIFTGVVDTESDVDYVPLDASRWSVTARSTRVVEIAHAGTPAEHEYPVGRDNGYMWKVNTYWRLDARSGGVFMESEGVSLSRDVPFGFGWIVNPIVDGLSRDTLRLMLLAVRRTLAPRTT